MAKTHCAPVTVKLVGTDGNAFALMGNWKRAALNQKRTAEEIEAVLDDCKSGDYDHLLCVLAEHSTEE